VEVEDAARAAEFGVSAPFRLIEFDLVLNPSVRARDATRRERNLRGTRRRS
jgi:hypothetical protein